MLPDGGQYHKHTGITSEMKINFQNTIWIIGSFLLAAHSIGTAHCKEQFKTPGDFISPIDWVDYINKYSRSGVNKTATNAPLVVLGPLGWYTISGIKGQKKIPKQYKSKMQYPEYVRGKIYLQTANFNIGPYASKDGQFRALSDYCARKNGLMQSGFCETASGPIFYLDVQKPIHDLRKFIVIEPLARDSESVRYFRSNMIGLGYIEPSIRKQASQIEAKLVHEINKKRIEAERREQLIQQSEASSRRKIGAKLCQRTDDWISVGFVEGKSPDTEKVQIRIVNKHLENQPRMQAGGFREQIIWDSPDKWFLCE